MRKITITDTTLVHAALMHNCGLTFMQKTDVARLLDKIKVDIIEMENMANPKVDNLLVKSIVSGLENSRISVPVALGETVVPVAGALETAKGYRLRVSAPLSAVRMEYIYHKKPAAIKDMTLASLNACRKYTSDIEFCADDATRSDREFLYEMIKVAIENGATTVTLCEEAGWMLPEEFGDFVKEVRENVPELEGVNLAVRCSDDISLANALAQAAISAGVSEVKTCAPRHGVTELSGLVKLLERRGESLGAGCDVTNVNIASTVEKIQDMFNLAKEED